MLLLIIVLFLLAAGIIQGYKRGIIAGLIDLVSWIVGILVLVVLAKGIGNFIHGSMLGVFMAVVILFVIRIVNKAIKIVMGSLKLVRLVPAGVLVDKIAGAVFGLISSVFFIWIVFLIFGIFDCAGINTWIMNEVNSSSLLQKLYYSNYIINILR